MDRRNFMKGGLAALASAAAASIAGCWGGGYFGSYMPPRQECQPLVVDINSINWVPAGREIYVGNVRTANCLVSPDWKFARLGDNVYRFNSWTNKMDIYVGRFVQQVQRNNFEDGLPTFILCRNWIDNGDKFMERRELDGLGVKSFRFGERVFLAGLNKTGREVRSEIVIYSDGKPVYRANGRIEVGGMYILTRSFEQPPQELANTRFNFRAELLFDDIPTGVQEFSVSKD